NFYRRMLALRRRTPALLSGDYELAPGPYASDEEVLAFYRRCPTQTCLVLQNWSANPQSLDFGAYGGLGKLLFSSLRAGDETPWDPTRVELAPFETLITEIEPA